MLTLCSVDWLLAVDWEQQVEEVNRVEGSAPAVFEGLEAI